MAGSYCTWWRYLVVRATGEATIPDRGPIVAHSDRYALGLLVDATEEGLWAHHDRTAIAEASAELRQSDTA
jgi:hypothetical protein